FKRLAHLHRLICCATVIIMSCELAVAERLPLKTYTTADGLPHNVINRIVRDSRGFLWFCTEEGLSRFDGYTFTNYGTNEGLPHPSVNDLLETRAGEYWVATGGGLVRFNPKGIPSGHVVYARDSPADAPNPPMFTVVIRVGASVPKDVLNDRIQVLREARRGRLWIGTRVAGLFRLTTTADHSVPVVARHYTHKDGLGADWIFDLYESADGKLWVGTNLGFCELSLDGGEVAQLRAYTKGNGLSFHEIVSLAEDRDGNLWLGTNNNGAQKLARPGFTTFAERDGLGAVNSLFETGAGERFACGYVL